jgi:septum site-determining protein MinD
MAAHTVYAVASGKGGVGKTTTTVNLGASLAEAGYNVAIVDTDLGMANLGGFIGVEPEETLHEVLAGEASLESATYGALNGLAVVPSGISLNGFANVDTTALADAVEALRDAFDYVLLDLGAGLSHDTVLPLALADAVILVSTPQPLSVQDTAKTREITERLGGRVAGVVLTRAGDPADLELDDVRDRLDLPVLAVIPEDQSVAASGRQGKAVLQHDPDSPAVEGYRGLADIIEAESLEDAPVVPEFPEPRGGQAAAGGAADEDAAADTEVTADTGDATADPGAADAGAAADDGDSVDAPAEADGTDTASEPADATADPADGPSPEDAATDGDQPAQPTDGGAAAGGPATDDGGATAGGPATDDAAQPESPAVEEPTDAGGFGADPSPAGGEQSADEGADTGGVPGDDAERTAADIAAAIEDAAEVPSGDDHGDAASVADVADEPETTPGDTAAGGAGDAASDPAVGDTPEATDEQQGGPPDADEGTAVDDLFGDDGGAESAAADAGADAGIGVEAGTDEERVATGEQQAAGAPAEETEDEGAALSVESHEADDSEESQAVDELFSVEGANPDEIDDEDDEESSGLLGGLFG